MPVIKSKPGGWIRVSIDLTVPWAYRTPSDYNRSGLFETGKLTA